MIRVFLKNTYKNGWFVTLPHEINNEFLFDIDQYTKKNITPWGHLDVGLSDFGTPIEFSIEKLDKLYHDYEILEKNLDEIIKLAPLPKKIGGWEWYNKSFIFFHKEGIEEFKKYFPDFPENEINDIVNRKNMIEKPTDFTKEDMLLIISLIKKKILEAKEKGETLVFSGD